jgi:ATP-dependent Clp endopeptidase proteolytic subunit ClpP
MKLTYRTQANAQAIAKIYNKPLENKEWFKIVNAKSDDEPSEILLFDYIGWPYNDPRDLIEALSGMKDVLIRVNSPGGDVWDGTAIYNAISSHKGGTVTTRIEGIAASMASVISMAGKTLQAYDNTMLMIHNAWSFTAGNQYEMAEMADLLAKVDTNILSAYQKKSKKSKKEISEMMKATTYLTAKEAKELGFVDEIVTGKSVKATYDLSIFGAMPEGLEIEGNEDEDDEPAIRKYEKALRDAGASKAEAKIILARGLKSLGDGEDEHEDDLDDTLEQDAKALAQHLSLASEIRKLTATMQL